MAGEPTVFRWRASPAPVDPFADAGLAERLAELVEDRASSARALVIEASERLLPWLGVARSRTGREPERAELEQGLAPFLDAHGWRAPIARWIRALRGALALAATSPDLSARELLLEELGLWLGGEGSTSEAETWRGEPLAPGTRLPSRGAGIERVAREFEPGEVILVHGWSESVAIVLERLFVLGRNPQLILSEGGADLGGRRLARELAEAGLSVRFTYDLALFEHLPATDRILLGCEAIGAGAFLARRGTRALLDAARRLEVDCRLVATSDKLSPDARLDLPRWPLRESWILWEDSPSRVHLDSQTHERVPIHLATSLLTELGWESAPALALRALPEGEAAVPRLARRSSRGSRADD